MKIQTNTLKKMLNQVSKCKPNGVLEITKYYELLFNKEGLTITATDGVNQISVMSKDGKQDEEQVIIVKAEQFSKLINKTTKENVELKVKGESLQVKGNGTYNIEIFTEEDYPHFEMDKDITFKVNTNELLHGLSVGKYTKAINTSEGLLYHYAILDSKVVSTDSIKVSCTAIKGFKEDVLISPPIAVLLESITEDRVEVFLNEDKSSIMFSTPSVEVSGAIPEGIDEYPDVLSLFEDDEKEMAELDVATTLNALDRLKLFISAYSKDLIDVTMTNEMLVLSTDKNFENIPFDNELEEEFEYDLAVNSNYFYDIVRAMKAEKFKLAYEDDIFLLEANNDKFILACADSEEE